MSESNQITAKQALTMAQANFDKYSLKQVNLNSSKIVRKNEKTTKYLTSQNV